MEQILTREEILELVKLPKNFDPQMIDLEYGFQSKIYPHISKQDLEQHKGTELFKNIAKAGVLYSFVLDIPKIKVHISNFGINQFEQNKTRNAPWWDVRDLGLSWLKKADFYLLSSLQNLSAPALSTFSLIPFDELNVFYSLNNSVESYLKMANIMQQIYNDFAMQFPECAMDDFLQNNSLNAYIKGFIINKALCHAIDSPTLVFLSSGIAVQYEELPWQKSVILSPQLLESLKSRYHSNAERFLKKTMDHLHQNTEQFPCINTQQVNAKIISKKSGLFL